MAFLGKTTDYVQRILLTLRSTISRFYERSAEMEETLEPPSLTKQHSRRKQKLSTEAKLQSNYLLQVEKLFFFSN